MKAISNIYICPFISQQTEGSDRRGSLIKWCGVGGHLDRCGAAAVDWRPQQPFIGTTIDDNVQTFYTGVLLMDGRQKYDVKLFCKPKDVNSCVKQM